jgi:SWI/SNF-related matrix-associated actin-dependent regulator 1 of chromatin subfamily A
MNVHMIDSVGTDPAQIQLRITQLFSFSDGLTIISYELFARLAGLLSMSARKLARFNTIVCDESHYLKETTSVRYKALRMHLLHAHNLFLLSGTPSPNRPVELFAQLQLLDSATFRSKETFSMRYCDGFIDQWGRFNARGASRERELAILLSRYMIRVTVNPDISSVELREVHRVVTEVEIEGLATNHAEQVRDVIQAVSSGAAAMNDVQSTVSALFLETARLKVGPILVLLRERLAGLIDEKVVLFCTHMVMFEAVKAELETSLPGKKHIAINGLTPMRGREAMVAEFLGPGDCRVALLTLGTCSTGINLVPVRHAIFLELDWTPAIIHQAECRINRIGGAASLYYEYLIAPNTLDDYVYRMLHRKSETICAIVDRGHTDAFNFG